MHGTANTAEPLDAQCGQPATQRIRIPACREEKAALVVCCNREMHRRPLSRMVTGEVRPFVGEAADTRYSNRCGGGPKNNKGVPLRKEDSARREANHQGQKIKFVAGLTHASQDTICGWELSQINVLP